ncbi:GNAT family N-acetyltransferase [Leptothrix sp. BB-4]
MDPAPLVPTSPSVQRLRLRDWPSARRVLQASFPDIDLQELRRALCSSPGLTGVVRGPDRRVVGIVTLREPDAQTAHWLPADRLWIDMLAVDARQRGRRLGELLVTWAGKQARDRGLDEIGLTVRHDNAAAIALYQRLGYAPDPDQSGQRNGRLRLLHRFVDAATPARAAGPDPINTRTPVPTKRPVFARTRVRLLHILLLVISQLQDWGLMELFTL